ncbi:OmpP1/FadL family transporter [Polaribacter butkevichii]|uniref:Hemin receptor n=1 Tax=Polaribacter butkevichii TaxID=218490 RepID=A0A2P6C8T3_9FLAO|nr:outer membrane protein transport protein [Polaribacter butkevichii]PQJ69329.1 hemin receptor [Polaribacter butkevichii]
MKKIITIATLFIVSITSYAQSLGYQDLGVLFSQNDDNGSARFTSMSGAFGALGGDVSSININPAGIAVFQNSTFSGTFNSRNTNINTNYYGNSLKTKDQFFNLSHAGAVLVFDSAYKSDWSKFAIGFNYRITKDFENSFIAQGNSGTATFRDFPLDNNTPTLSYDIADEQRFANNYGGEISEFNVAFSSVHQNRLYLGLGLNFYDLDFSQQSLLTEFNNDGNGNDLDANYYQENRTIGTGFSANAGFIYKVNSNFRFGLAYQTPTWYSEIIESTNITENEGNRINEIPFFGDTEIAVSNSNDVYDNTSGGYFPTQELLYKLKTPSKLTASAAFIFGKDGLISLDYINRSYQNMKLKGSNFTDENQFFENDLRNTHSFNLGTEWRFDRASVRAGYKYEQDPSKFTEGKNNLKGYSLGAGYNFGGFKLDFAFSDNNRTNLYNFYSGFDSVDPASLKIDNKTITATVTLNL